MRTWKRATTCGYPARLGSTLLSLLTLALFGCPSDPVDPNNMADMGEVDMAIAPPSCAEAGECLGRFAGWQCIGGVCTDCGLGEFACACRANGTCKDDLKCDDATSICERCAPGEASCPCDDAGGCGEGLTCQAGTCFSSDCAPGALDCPCDNGSCANMPESYCDDNEVCRGCTSDIPGCRCSEDDTCEGDNFCDTRNGSLCATCPGEDRPIGCVCQETSDCDRGLVCDEDAGRCREKRSCGELCVPNQECDGSRAGDPICVIETCVDGFEWDSETSTCVELSERTCDGRDGSEDLSPQCVAENKECVEVGGVAVCVQTCAMLGAACAAERRECAPSALAGQDATCGVCVPGFQENGTQCVPDPGANCSPVGDPASIAPTCQARNQVCESQPGGGAQCGTCLAGFEFNATLGACVEQALCSGRFCADNEYCQFPQTGGPPACAPKPCGPDQAFDQTSGQCTSCDVGALACDAAGIYPSTVGGACQCASDVFCSYQYDGAGERCITSPCGPGEAQSPGGQCVSCQNTCGTQRGERTRLWPLTSVTGTCLCETQEGFYRPFGGSNMPLACDEDRDGWINRTAKATFDAASDLNQGQITSDEAILSNFRCDIRRIDRFILKNEWGQERHVSVCGDDMIDYAPGTPALCTHVDGIKALVLFESDSIDDDVSITNDPTTFPLYGSRAVKGAEVNALTKLCVSQTGDFNNNQIEDVQEQQAVQRQRLAGAADTSTDENFAFLSMSHFGEIHRSSYLPPANFTLPGSYLIEERSRCEPGFPMVTADGASGYWQNCSRGRRGDYSFSGSHVGHDFGHYSCSSRVAGSCDMPAPPVVVPEVDADNDRIPDHGLCDQTGPLPNEPWRGMTHHSQFQCVVLNRDIPLAEVYASSDIEAVPYDFNECTFNDCGAGQMGCVESTDQGEYQPQTPELTCIGRQRGQVQNDQVGWVTVRYLGETSTASLARPYVRGCFDESFGLDGTNGWANLCPGFEANPDSVLAAGNLGNSGLLLCSCNANYGGSNCEVACKERLGLPNPTRFLHVGDRDRGYEVSELQEYACDPASKFCSLHPPVLADGFEGGRRGYWMCGDTSLSLSRNTSGDVVPALKASATIQGTPKTYELRGGVQNAPVVREPLEFTGQLNGQNRTYRLY